MPSRLVQAWRFVRQRGSGFGLQVLVNAVLPLIIFNLEQKRLGDVGALLASSAPPILWSLIEFARHRKVDAISVLALSGIALSLLAFIGTGGAKFLQLRETLVGGLIGLLFVGSVLIRRPLIYYLARASMRRTNPAEAQNLESLKGNVYFERTMTTLTLVWGLGLLTHTTFNCALVFAVSIPTYLAVAPVVGYAFVGAMSLWSYLYVRRQQAKGQARRAEAVEAEAMRVSENAPQAAETVAS
jgi:intracellular septation protein A